MSRSWESKLTSNRLIQGSEQQKVGASLHSFCWTRFVCAECYLSTGHHEPIGPSSHPISLRNFLESARANVSHWRQTDISPDITAKYLDGLSEEQQTALVDRCR